MVDKADERTAAQLLRQHDRLSKVRRDLVKQGLVNGDARPDDILAAIRKLIPVDMFD